MSKYHKQEEINAVDIQLIALGITLISTLISIIITYNQKLDLEEKETILNSKEAFKLTKFNRILILILSLVFLYVNTKLYKISKEEGEDLKPYKLQIIASVLAIVSGLIALYVVGLSETENLVDVENPVI